MIFSYLDLELGALYKATVIIMRDVNDKTIISKIEFSENLVTLSLGFDGKVMCTLWFSNFLNNFFIIIYTNLGFVKQSEYLIGYSEEIINNPFTRDRNED